MPMPPRVAVRLIGALALVIGACSAQGQPGHAFRIVEEDGVPVALSSAVPRHAGELFRYEKIVVLRPDPADDASLLYQPYSFTLGDDGHYYVADRGNHRVAVFDGESNFVGAFGREGQGPGELRGPRLVEMRDNVVTVVGARTSYFRADGSFIDVSSHPGGEVHRLGDGKVLVIDSVRTTRDDGAYFGARARVLDAADELLASVETDQRRMDPFLKYVGDPVVALTEGGEIFASSGAEPELSWYGHDGRLLRQVRIELPLEPVTDEDRAAMDRLWDLRIEVAQEHESGIPIDGLRDFKGSSVYPTHRAYWERPLLDGGWVWLPAVVPDTGLGQLSGPPAESPRWFRIVDPEGRFVGTTAWPEEAVVFNGARIVRGHLLTMVWDEQAGEVLPTVYRILPVVDGLVYP